jgi:preprotein translocase subunit SecF
MPIHFLPNKPNIDFMGKRWIGFAISIFLTLACMGLLFTKGLNLGIDFTGGILMEIHTEKPADLHAMREKLGELDLGEVTLQNSGGEQDVLIRIQVNESDDQAKVTAVVKQALADVAGEGLDYRKIDFVGPTVGKELVNNGIIAVLLSNICVKFVPTGTLVCRMVA